MIRQCQRKSRAKHTHGVTNIASSADYSLVVTGVWEQLCQRPHTGLLLRLNCKGWGEGHTLTLLSLPTQMLCLFKFSSIIGLIQAGF